MIQIKRTIHEQEDMRTYHSRTPLCDQPVGAEAGMEEMSEEPVLRALLKIPGVAAGIVHRYHMDVIRATMFEWSEIEPSILRLLSALNTPLEESKLMEER